MNLKLLIFATALFLSPAAGLTNEIFDSTKRRAEQGDEEAQFEIGLMYYHGNGVSVDYVSAAKWFLKVAENGNAVAQYTMGGLYHNGDGVPKNEIKSGEWFLKSASQGYPKAMIRIGNMYSNGIVFERDESKAFKWLNGAFKRYSVAAAKGSSSLSDFRCNERRGIGVN